MLTMMSSTFLVFLGVGTFFEVLHVCVRLRPLYTRQRGWHWHGDGAVGVVRVEYAGEGIVVLA